MKSTKVYTLDYKLDTILVLDEANSVVSNKYSCLQPKAKRTNYFQAVVKTLNGCNSGYQCITITSRSDFVAEIKMGKVVASIAAVDCGDNLNSELVYGKRFFSF